MGRGAPFCLRQPQFTSRFIGSLHVLSNAHWDHEPTRGRAALLRRRNYCSQAAEHRSPTSRFMESLDASTLSADADIASVDNPIFDQYGLMVPMVQRAVSIAVCLLYLMVSLSVASLHHHDADSHEPCAACAWQRNTLADVPAPTGLAAVPAMVFRLSEAMSVSLSSPILLTAMARAPPAFLV